MYSGITIDFIVYDNELYFNRAKKAVEEMKNMSKAILKPKELRCRIFEALVNLPDE